MRPKLAILCLIVFFFMAMLSSCTAVVSPSQPTARIENNPESGFITSTPGVSVVAPVKLWIDPNLPPGITTGLVVPLAVETTTEVVGSDLQVMIGGGQVITRLVYALAAPFPTLVDGVSSGDIKNAWSGISGGPFAGKPILLTENTLHIFSQWWGIPADGAVMVLPEEQLIDYAWNNSPSWALIPFENLGPRWKVLQVDGLSPIWKDFSVETYPLSIPVSVAGENPELVNAFALAFASSLQSPYNRDPAKLTTIIVTGVTALVRATAFEMETHGITYPGEDVGEIMREADITHISNEVSFAEDCPAPDPYSPSMKFCSDPSYIELLEFIGTDVVELTGDHLSDWGDEAMYYTLNMYKELGWPYYGGGATLAEGRQPLTLLHNGNKIAFIGCNGKGGGHAKADATTPGAASCDIPGMQADVTRLVGEGYVVIFTFQHLESYESYTPSEYLINDFRVIAEAGAQIISGSQAHRTHSMTFYGSQLLMYGLGNLFFDQFTMGEPTARALFARHVVYDGRYISTEIFTVRFLDFSTPRLMSMDDRIQFLEEVFTASGW